MYNYKYWLGLLALILSLNTLSAQTIQPAVINTAGSSATIGPNTFEWSVGEMVLVNTAIASGITVTQGLLQPIEQSSGINESKLSLSELSVYPNPTTDQLWLQWHSASKITASIQVTDVTGRLCFQKELKDRSGIEAYVIDLSLWAAGAYMLAIHSNINGQQFFNSFKVVKQ